MMGSGWGMGRPANCPDWIVCTPAPPVGVDPAEVDGCAAGADDARSALMEDMEVELGMGMGSGLRVGVGLAVVEARLGGWGSDIML